LLFVCVIFVPLLLILVANVAQLPELLLLQVEVRLSPSVSLTITCRSGVKDTSVLPSYGVSPLCVGA
jgi:hypothetical protein